MSDFNLNQSVGGWHSRIESLQVLLSVNFGLWNWTWIVTIGIIHALKA